MSKVIRTSAEKPKKHRTKEDERIPCPFCKELILVGAKKCRFCKENLYQGEKLVTSDSDFFTKKITPARPYGIWVLSMLFFLVSLSQLGIESNSYWFLAMLGSVVVGFVAFLALLAIIPSSKGRYGIITLLTFFIFFGLLFNYETIASAFGFKSQSKSEITPSSDSANITVSPSSSPSPLPSKAPFKPNSANSVQGNQTDCIGPDGKQFETTMDECKNLNEKWGKPVDYIVNCVFPSECGGGSRSMKKSECDKPCQPINGNNNLAPQAPQNNNSGSQLNFYCYDNTGKYSYYTSYGEQCNLNNIKSSCRSIYKSIYNMCSDNCTSEANNRSHDCIYNHDEPETTTCLNDNGVKHQQCLDGCGNTYQEDLAKCN